MLQWLGQLQNSKTVALLIFFTVFCGILLYLYSSRKRGRRLESYKYIPFDDEQDAIGDDEGKKQK